MAAGWIADRRGKAEDAGGLGRMPEWWADARMDGEPWKHLRLVGGGVNSVAGFR